jgi:hypothetical protein
MCHQHISRLSSLARRSYGPDNCQTIEPPADGEDEGVVAGDELIVVTAGAWVRPKGALREGVDVFFALLRSKGVKVKERVG